MARIKKQDAWVAHVRICVPIDATDVASIQRAQESVRKLASLIPGSSVEITHAGFGRMALPEPPKPGDLMSAMADIKVQVEDGAITKITPPATAEPEIPAPLRRVPRFDNGGSGELDPSIDAR